LIAKYVLAALFIAGVSFATAQAQTGGGGGGGGISLSDYRARLAQALADLNGGGDPSLALPPIPPVALPSGESVQPGPLFPAQSERAVASARLATAIDQLDLSANDDSAARLAQLDRVAERLDLLQPSLWQRFTRWLRGWIDRLLPDSGPLAGTGLGSGLTTLVGWLVIGGGGLLVVLLLGYWLRHLLGGLLRGQHKSNAGAGEDGLPATAAQARQQASQMAESGNFREAVRRLYLAALLRLRERDLIRFDSSLTNQEVLARMQTNAPARAHLEPVVDIFDRVWYGEQEPDAETFERYSREIDALLQERTGVGRG
jgi:hypothetical protein